MKLSHEEIEQIHFEVCEGCKGFKYFWDSDCRELCDGWTKAIEQYEQDNSQLDLGV